MYFSDHQFWYPQDQLVFGDLKAPNSPKLIIKIKMPKFSAIILAPTLIYM